MSDNIIKDCQENYERGKAIGKAMGENIFIKRDQESKAEYEQLGLGDLDAITAMSIKNTSEEIIKKNNITDEDEKRKVYQDVRQQKLEYQEQRRKEIEAEYDRKQEQIMLEYKAKQEQEKETEKQPFKLSEKLEELAEDNKITRLEVKVQQLDERLAKLEKYTQE